jgi:hypothetical protein
MLVPGLDPGIFAGIRVLPDFRKQGADGTRVKSGDKPGHDSREMPLSFEKNSANPI